MTFDPFDPQPDYDAIDSATDAELGFDPLDAEPTALAYTPDHLMPTEPMPQSWIDALDNAEAYRYASIEGLAAMAGVHPAMTGRFEVAPDKDDPEETFRLALESAQRWLNNYRLSPAMRLRALRSVVSAALSDQSGS